MRKNILIFGHNYATQFVDIYNQYTQIFDPAVFNVTVVFLTGKYDDSVRQRTLAENVCFLNCSKSSIRYLKLNAIRKLYELTRLHRYEIVICHRYKPTYIMLAVSKFLKVPLIISVMHEFHTMQAWGRKFFIRNMATNNLLFAGVSNAVRNNLRKDLSFLPPERIITLYNMIDQEITEPEILHRDEARNYFNLKNDDFVFGNIARLAINKNQERLLTAFAQINQQHPKTKLIIIGDGTLEHELKDLVRNLHLEHAVLFTGFLPKAFRFMRAFDCFVLPSIQEAFGRVLLEAMLAKLPIIAGKIHGIPEVLAESGILINPFDSKELITAMQKIYLNANIREQLSTSAYQRVSTHFTIPQFNQQFWQMPCFQA